MSTQTETASPLDGSVVLVPAADLVEMPVADEAILWHSDRVVPLQLNPVATTIWWHFETASLDEIGRDVAQHYRQPVERVMPGVHFVARSLHDAGLLRTTDERADQPPTPVPTLGEHQRSGQIGRASAAWLQRRAAHRVSAQAGQVRFGVASNTAELNGPVASLFSSRLDGADSAAIRYYLIDAGDVGPGCRYWLLSDTGLPLELTDSSDDLVERLALHVAELAAVQDTIDVPLRLAVLEARNHAVAVQWDLLASRPVLEPALEQLGYRIRSGQWAVIDSSDLTVRPSATLEDSPEESRINGLPLGAIVGWFGPGSLALPNTQAEWAWTLAMFGCASPDPGEVDRHRLLETAIALAKTCRVESLSDAGPSALLHALTDISRSWNHD